MFTVHTADSAPAGSAAALRQRIGVVPNLAASMAGSPTLISGFVALQQVLRDSTLTGAEREVIGLTVRDENACRWSMAAHSVFADANGVPGDVVEALRAGKPLPDPRLHALHEFTATLLRTRGHVSAEQTDALRAAGFDTEQMLEVIAQTAYTSMANWVANLADPPLDEAFRPREWSP